MRYHKDMQRLDKGAPCLYTESRIIIYRGTDMTTKAEEKGGYRSLFNMDCTEEEHRARKELAKRIGRTQSETVRRALAMLAQAHGMRYPTRR